MKFLAAIALATTVASQYCTPNPNSCQIQSDPFVSTFQGPVTEFHKEGTFYAFQSDEMNILVTISSHYVSRLARNMLVVDKVVFKCIDGQSKTFETATLTSAQKLVCSCASAPAGSCSLTVVPGVEPVPNVSVQEIRYLGTKAIGGLCFGAEKGCVADGFTGSATCTLPKTPSSPANNATPASTVTATTPSATTPSTTKPSSTSVAVPAGVVPSINAVPSTNTVSSTCTSNAVPPTTTNVYTAPTGLFQPTFTYVPVTAYTTNLMYSDAKQVAVRGVSMIIALALIL
ncbi:UNVERIFIED_CONTAM: hypothetical protein HDU68_006551 [Siphonaria sp. JEL0065]|nr:hypothetical protein HDU68_006551 [Siphonaria sp. JEL0065]